MKCFLVKVAANSDENVNFFSREANEWARPDLTVSCSYSWSGDNWHFEYSEAMGSKERKGTKGWKHEKGGQLKMILGSCENGLLGKIIGR